MKLSDEFARAWERSHQCLCGEPWYHLPRTTSWLAYVYAESVLGHVDCGEAFDMAWSAALSDEAGQ